MGRFFKSFIHAFQGFKEATWSELNFRFHLFAAVMVLALSFYLQISKIEWCLIILCIGMVISMELVNTSIERLSDKVEPSEDPGIKNVKDISAASVLIISICSAVIAAVIFLPKLLK